MSVSPTVLLVTLAVGIPLMLIALGVLYQAYLFGRAPAVDALEEHVGLLATESAEELLVALQEAVDEMQAQLAQQRQTLAGMLSDSRPAFASVAPLSLDDDRPTAAGEYVHRPADASPDVAPSDVRTRIAELADQGMSDRSIARELHIGLEEVRIARMWGRQS